MSNIIAVGVGGFVGSVFRFLLAGAVHRISGNPWFPYGTLCVNVIGCLLIGLVGGWADHREVFSPAARLFLMVGFLGGFTTFSTFGYETLNLLRDAQPVAALTNVALHVGLGFAAVWLGYGFAMSR